MSTGLLPPPAPEAPSARRLTDSDGEAFAADVTYHRAEFFDDGSEVRMLRQQVKDLEEGKMAYVVQRTNRLLEREEAIAVREAALSEREAKLKKAEQELANERIDVEKRWLEAMGKRERPVCEVSTQTCRNSPSPPVMTSTTVGFTTMTPVIYAADRTSEPVFDSSPTRYSNYATPYNQTASTHRRIPSPPPPMLSSVEHKHHHHHHHHYTNSDADVGISNDDTAESLSELSDDEFLRQLSPSERKQLSLHYDITRFLDMFKEVFESVDKTETGTAPRGDLRRAIRSTSKLRRQFPKFGELLRVLDYGNNKITITELKSAVTKLMLGQPIRKTPVA
eukprot:TRINITY_DN24899_c0_g1_i1.p1 TRINITY_DN24899_c0_g1~~TRINITY_DN24899_c0_g1_i1.p1  ORF type:complete len:336 (+),score=71.72 TRINITY_DN24899_c0_g1_i1:122-1129(+)